jgi:hypothetical protein
VKLPRYHTILLAVLTVAGSAADQVPVAIDVRSSVDQRWEGWRKRGPVTQGRVYLLAAVTQAPSADRLLKPVDEARLAALLRRELAAHGFREITAQEKPDVVLTVSYGRGFLKNPHLDEGTLDELTPGIPTLTVTSPKQAQRQREPGFEAKAQRAQFEKLFVTISAWRYPGERREKPHLLWRTSMLTDDPDGRDLNGALPALLAAGAGYFDRETREGEVTVNSSMPAGSVRLGPLHLIEPGPPGR